MSKTLLVLIAVVAAALIIGGVLEVRVHPDQLTHAPARVSALVKDKKFAEQSRAALVDVKRGVEQFIIQDEEQRLKVALLYVTADAERTTRMIGEEGADPVKILPQANLLGGSLRRARTLAADTSEDTLAALKEDSTKAFLKAEEALGQLTALKEGQEKVQEELVEVTDSLAEQLGSLEPAESANKESEVAGTQEEGRSSEETAKESEITPIPLRF